VKIVDYLIVSFIGISLLILSIVTDAKYTIIEERLKAQDDLIEELKVKIKIIKEIKQ